MFRHHTGNMILYGWGDGNLVSNAIMVHAAGIQMATAIDAVKMYWNPGKTRDISRAESIWRRLPLHGDDGDERSLRLSDVGGEVIGKPSHA